MSTSVSENLQKTKQAARNLIKLSETKINEVLNNLADKIDNNINSILSSNKLDTDKADPNDPKYPRLQLNEKKVQAIATSIRDVAKLPSPLNRILLEKNLPNDLHLQKVTVPLGVLGVIYEARPNVTPDIFSLCFKSGNGCVLKGGSDAYNSHKVFFEIIQETLQKSQTNPDIIYLMPPEREFIKDLFTAHGLVDVVIPRGSQNLINFTRQNCEIPVIETGAGVCHTYWEASGKIEYAKQIIYNAKTSRPFACNALDTLIIDADNLNQLDQAVEKLIEDKIIIWADSDSYNSLENKYPAELLKKATEESFGTEFLGYQMSIKTVLGYDQATKEIQKFSSGHSEAIITENSDLAKDFQKIIDAASVYVNTSTAFTDGGQFGLGCEIGISTQKLHARGPMGLQELTSYKWLVDSQGQIRN